MLAYERRLQLAEGDGELAQAAAVEPVEGLLAELDRAIDPVLGVRMRDSVQQRRELLLRLERGMPTAACRRSAGQLTSSRLTTPTTRRNPLSSVRSAATATPELYSSWAASLARSSAAWPDARCTQDDAWLRTAAKAADSTNGTGSPGYSTKQ
jgi:hypothetical protein